MEADWEFEVGPDAAGLAAPVIEAAWPGFVDLQLFPERAWLLLETADFPALAEALIKLNAPGSLVCSSKCDLWPQLEAGEFDPDELDAPLGCAVHAMGCYIDLLPRGDLEWLLPAMVEAWCKNVCDLLRAIALRCCRVDLVVRRALVSGKLASSAATSMGVTAYVTSCGENAAEAARTLAAALGALADAGRCAKGHSTLE